MRKRHSTSYQDNSFIHIKNATTGITLIALVVTIVVLLILAGITITYIMGDNGIFKKALDAKTQAEIGRLKERIEIIQSDWWMDKKLDPTVTLDDFWERLIEDNIIGSKEDIEGPEKEGENDIYILDTTEGYKVEVIITPDGDIIIGEIIKGDSLPPKVQSIEVTNKTSNSIEVKVTVSRLEGGKLSYYYKKESETEYRELKDKIKVTDLTAIYAGLEQNQIYNIKVVAENKKGKGEKVINVLTGELETGVISQKGETTWANSKASIELETTNTTLTLKYQVGGIDDDKWLPYNGPIGNLNHDDTVYAVLTDGTNYGEVATIVIRDGVAPTNATITLGATTANTGANVTATVTHNDAQSGPKIASCKWVYNTTSTKIGTNASSYTGGTFSSNGQTINLNASAPGTYYLHVLTTDNGGNVWETVSNAVTVNQLATGVTVSPTTVNLKVGETQQLTATVTPTNASNKGVTWSSSNTGVATVSSSGLVTAKDAGTVTITATTADGTNKSATCTVRVTQITTAIELNSVRARIATGYTRWLNAVATPSNVAQEFTWTSSNTNVATVDSTGKVTAKAAGTTTITVKTKDGTNLSKTCTVTVATGVDVTTLTNIQSSNKIARDSYGNLITVPRWFQSVNKSSNNCATRNSNTR